MSSVTGSGGTRRPPATPDGKHNYSLPQDSVVISDRKRSANKVGEGSFAKVYRRKYNGKPCAVKVFKEEKVKKELSSDPGSTSEVELVSKVRHMNIVQMYRMWLDPHKDRAASLIMIKLSDESQYDFKRRLKGKIVPNKKKLPILQDTAKGMVYLRFKGKGERAAPSIVMELSDESQYDFIRRFKGKLALSAHMYSLRRHSFHWVGGCGVVLCGMCAYSEE